MSHPRRRAFTLIEMAAVVLILAMLIAILLPVLSRIRKSALAAKLASEPGHAVAKENTEKIVPTAPSRPRAHVKTFAADIVLTPRLSVGTAEPESIYEAKFNGEIQAVQPADNSGECELELPLPPAIISLADLSITAAGQPSNQVSLRDGKLVWSGPLPAPQALEITYTAVGKGLYELSVPPGGRLDHFQITVAANGSDVRMLELSLQPTSLARASGTTTYIWDYRRLLSGQPIRLDVLGIAPIDRLGELAWLGPLSVIVFGLLLGLTVHAVRAERFDRWMLLLTLGTFAGVYPLMYFAQEFISLEAAVLVSAALMLAIIGIRALTIVGPKLTLAVVVLPALGILTITMMAVVWPRLQGILLTGEALGFFIAAMMLIPRLRQTSTASA
jgi:prepilin-type N-terminal cleavage/methylation domain-containing protein